MHFQELIEWQTPTMASTENILPKVKVGNLTRELYLILSRRDINILLHTTIKSQILHF